MKLIETIKSLDMSSKIIFLFLVLVIPLTTFKLGISINSQSTDKNLTENLPIPTNSDSQISNWSKPESTDQFVPAIKNQILSVYSLSTKQLLTTDYKTDFGGGKLGFGDGKPLPSPNGKFIAFRNLSDNGNLYLIPSGNLTAIKITDFPVQYIIDWSPDSSKLLYYAEGDNLLERKTPQGEGFNTPWIKSESFQKDLTPGFHSFNLDTGIDVFLYPLSSVEKFVDSKRILSTVVEEWNQNQKHYVLFDIETFTADYATFDQPIINFATQLSFANDGLYWVHNDDGGGTDKGTKMIFSKFPEKTGTLVDSGTWAQIQKPLFSPNGRYLAYTKKGNKIESGEYAGQYSDTTVIWDTSTKKMIKQLDGFPEYWVGDSIIIGRVIYGSYAANFTSYDIYNPISQELNNFPVK